MIPQSIRALPCWQGEITAEPLHGGLSNESWKVTDAAGTHVVRFGRDYPFHHVDRAREVMTARAAHAAGFGPAVEYAAPGVSVGQFITAATWTGADVCAAPDRVGALLRRFHHEMPAQITGAAYVFPAGAKLRTVALQGYFTQIAGTWDSNGDGVVNGDDLGLLLSAWGTANAAADINDDGTVNGDDLGILLGAWS